MDKGCVRCEMPSMCLPTTSQYSSPHFFQIVNRRKKWQIDDDSDDDDVSDAYSVESTDSDDNEETDTESSDTAVMRTTMRCTIRNRTMIYLIQVVISFKLGI